MTFIAISATSVGLDAYLYAGSSILLVAGIFTWCGAGVVLFQYRLLQNRYKCCRFLFYFCYGCCLDDKDKRNCQKDLKCCFTCCRKCRTCCANEEQNSNDRQDTNTGSRRSHRTRNTREQPGDSTDGTRVPLRDADIYIYADGTYGPHHSQRSGPNARTRAMDDDTALTAILERPSTRGGEGMRPGTSLHSVLSLPPAYEDPDPHPPPYTDEPPPAYVGEDESGTSV